MSEENNAQSASAPDPIESAPAPAQESDVVAKDEESATVSDAKPVAEPTAATTSATDEPTPEDSEPAEGQPATTQDVDMPTREKPTDDGSEASPPEPTKGAEISASKDKKARRQSTGVPEHKGKKLNKKQSKAKLTNTTAQPGDHFYIRLKGYPLWPGIVADEEMLPEVLIKTRPLSARRADGNWADNYAEGGKSINDRTFPVMYLSTNEFGWIRNTDLLELDFATVAEKANAPKMRADLKEAHIIAADQKDIEYFKDILREAEELRQVSIEEAEAKQAAAQEKAAAKEARKTAAEEKKATGASKPKRKSTLSEAAVEGDDEDVDMADANMDPEEKPKSKKRKAEGEEGTSTPQRAQSVKKPKIKINNTPKANGSETPKTASKKEAKPKSAKAKKTNGATNGDLTPGTPKEAEMTEDEKRLKKEKEILFYRHRLQKGLLTKEQAPKAEDMEQMSEFITKLEAYADLEVSIIRATKINKVLKAILKLEEIPKESEFNFKSRSQSLLEKWNKILESGSAPSDPAAAPAPAEEKNETEVVPSEATNGKAKPEEPETKVEEEKTVEDTPMEDVSSKDESGAPAATKAEESPSEGKEEAVAESAITESAPTEDAAKA